MTESQGYLGRRGHKIQAEIDRLTAENRKLRAALERFFRWYESPITEIGASGERGVLDQVRKALANEETK